MTEKQPSLEDQKLRELAQSMAEFMNEQGQQWILDNVPRTYTRVEAAAVAISAYTACLDGVTQAAVILAVLGV